MLVRPGQHPLWGAQPTLGDGVVTVGPFELRDTPSIINWDTDPEIQRWYDWPTSRTPGHDYEQSARQTVLSKWASWVGGDELSFAIRDATGLAVGWCDLHPRGGGRSEMAYGVLSAYRGRGFATRAVALLAYYAFERLGSSRIELKIEATNLASRAVAARLGFREDGVIPDFGMKERYEPLIGQRFDMVVYSLAGDDRPSRP